MTTIRASCPMCGDVELTPVDIRLVVCTHPAWSFYSFTCNSCQELVRKPADADIVALLMSGSVTAEMWTVPAEVLEPRFGPTISYDEVLDFALWLDETDQIAAAIRPRVGA
jgi:hypothetical protein